MKTLTISLAQIVANARQAHAQGRLQAQTNPGAGACTYAGPCGIGVFGSLEYEAVRNIQRTHDEWTRIYHEYRPGAELVFLAALDEAAELVEQTV